jgi:hypothetical protein
VNILPLVDHLGSFASVLSLPAAFIALAAWLRKKRGAARTLTLSVALLVALAAYAIDISDRLGWMKFSERPLTDLILNWGYDQGAMYMIVNSRPLLDYKAASKLLLILNVPYSNVDKMTDPAIEKSPPYTITGEVIVLAVPFLGAPLSPSPKHLRVTAPPNSKVGESFSVPVNYFLVLIPIHVSPDEIRSLSDVESFGGRIITTTSTKLGPFTVNAVTEKPGG